MLPLPSTLTREQFANACKALDGITTTSPEHGLIAGWCWKEHPVVSGLGYLSRDIHLSWRSSGSLDVISPSEEEMEVIVDEAELDTEAVAPLRCIQYVAYSVTYQVPVFYFSIFDHSGTPLPLASILDTTLIKPHALPRADITPFALSASGSSFPLLSQGDHPTLGTPCWYFHPCETSAAVVELVHESYRDDWNEEDRTRRWMEAWFAVLSSVVDLRL